MTTANPSRRGYTLVELLTVITILAILSALVVPAVQGLGSADKVSTAGNVVAGIIDQAREVAIAKNTPTAVVVLATGSNVADRVLTILQYVPAVAPSTTGSWTQATKWFTLPSGVSMDGSVTSFLPPTFPVPTSPAAPLPALSYLGTTYNPSVDYGYFIVLQNGSIFHDTSGYPTSCKARLISVKGSASDYYDIIVNDATGHTKIVRP